MLSTFRSATAALAVAALVAGCRASNPASGIDTGGRAAASELPADATAAMVSEGDSLFNRGACVRCHGANGTGGANGPSLVTGRWLHADGSFSRLVAIITDGVPREALKDASRRFAMNPRGGPMNLRDSQVRALAAYVHSISRGKERESDRLHHVLDSLRTSSLPTAGFAAVTIPGAPGSTTMVLRIDDGRWIPPHTHNVPKSVRVVQGILLVGHGERIDATTLTRVAAGDSTTMDAAHAHFEGAIGRTLVVLTASSPFTTTWVRTGSPPAGRVASSSVAEGRD